MSPFISVDDPSSSHPIPSPTGSSCKSPRLSQGPAPNGNRIIQMEQLVDLVHEADEHGLVKWEGMLTRAAFERSGGAGVVEEKHEDTGRFKLLLSEEELKLLEQEAEESRDVADWVRFDLLFGAIIVIYGVVVCLVAAGDIEQDTLQHLLIESAFLVLFCIEFGLRLWWAPHGLFLTCIHDNWIIFDMFILSVAVLQSWILPLTPVGRMLSVAPVLRVSRLFRLVRLIRLIKLFKEMWLLVSGLLGSARVVGWSVFMLLLITYIAGIVMREIVGDTGQTGRMHEHWGSLWRTMLSLLQIATYDGWGDIMRDLVKGPIGEPDRARPWCILVIVIFMALTSLGILNLIVGILLTSSLLVTQKDQAYQGSIHRLESHMSLQKLRDVLTELSLEEGEDNAGMPMVTRQQLKDLIEEGPSGTGILGKLAAGLHRPNSGTRSTIVLDETSNPREEAVTSIKAAGLKVADIDTVFNEIESCIGVPKDSAANVDDFIEGCMWIKGQVHPLNVLHILAGLRSMHSRYQLLSGYMTSALAAMRDMGEQLEPILTQYHSPGPETRSPGKARKEAPSSGTPSPSPGKASKKGKDAKAKSSKDGRSPGGGSPEKDHETKSSRSESTSEAAKDKDSRAADDGGALEEGKTSALKEFWVRFNAFFGCFVALNGAVIGFEAQYNVFGSIKFMSNTGRDNAIISSLYFFDLFFLGLFTCELGLRALMFYQVDRYSDERSYWIIMPSRAWEMGWHERMKAFVTLPKYALQDYWICFDILLVLMMAIDTLVIQHVGLDDIDTTTAVKQLLLLRLLRLLRLIHLFRDLQILVDGMIVSFPLLFWALMMLIGLIYMGGIFMVEVVGKGPHKDNPAIIKYWGGLPQAMLTLMQVATFDHWVERLREVNDLMPGMVFFFLGFATVAGLGLMNLVVGVMVQAAFGVIRSARQDQERMSILRTRQLLVRAIDELFSDLRLTLQQKQEAVQAIIRASQPKLAESDTESSHESTDSEGIRRPSRKPRKRKEVTAHAPCPEVILNDDCMPMALGKNMPEWDGSKTYYCGQTSYTSTSLHHQSLEADGCCGPNNGPACLPCRRAQETLHIKASDLTGEFLPFSLLQRLLEDVSLAEELVQKGLRKDQIVMVFQKLDTADSGKVRVLELIEGLLRMKQPVQGVDIACAKSLMRRFVKEGASLADNASRCHECFRRVVEKLRGVQVLGAVDGTEEVARDIQGESDAMLQRQRLGKSNAALRLKIGRMRAHIDSRRQLLGESTDRLDTQSIISSAGTGAD